MKNSGAAGASERSNDSISNSDPFATDMVVQMEACSLGEIPPNLTEELVSQSLER